MIDYNKFISKNVSQLQPSGIRKFFDVANEIQGVISLGVGEPDFVTPWNVRDAAIKSIQKGLTQYTSNSGITELRNLIARYIEQTLNLDYEPKNEIIITVGASEAIDISLRAILNSGDEVLLPEPSYVSYAPCITLAGGIAKSIPSKVEHEFRIQPQDLENAITEKTKAIILPYPNNPTGAIMEKADLEVLVPIIKKHNLIVISDEIYSELTYDTQHCSIATFEDMRERTILINGFSKAFAMTGWRLGYVLAPAPLIYAMLKIHQYVIMCAPTCSQYAAIAALQDGFADNFATVRQMRDEYNMRRNFVVKRLNEIGLKCFEPKGAFYVFPSVKDTGLDGEEFSMRLLEKQKVAVVPGASFGDCGKDYIRISYAYSIKSLDEALARIETFVATLTNNEPKVKID
ncbi:MAG TPA: aminotransferase class I/II-fold pyridoxal phosphate-dependent enzyme [Clostridia bacterium]|nr:aminotransferase class I/II-fold pyridoxal phosphate-dependent enzyme [Clostridia bacterium]